MSRTSTAWQALLAEARRLELPRLFTGDLFRDYERLTATNAPRVFIWGIRPTGTDLLWDVPGWNRWLDAIARANPQQRWYFWSGDRLTTADVATVARRLRDAVARQHA